ncbi:MAG: hypothetical protein IPH13_09145 [Planctomycetes bacterium]|nr:hypothetical protein [Planctomycetota bacterium]MCC7171696.1 hypothetical protein [Planctomycetota bacterium]
MSTKTLDDSAAGDPSTRHTLEPETWSVHGEFEYTALAAAVKLPGMPDDAKLTLRELRGKGSGDYELDPSLPLPRSSTAQATLDLKADAPVKDKVEPIDATITMRAALITSQR